MGIEDERKRREAVAAAKVAAEKSSAEPDTVKEAETEKEHEKDADKEQEKEKEKDKKEVEEDEPEDEKEEDIAQDATPPPKVDLSAEKKRMTFRKGMVPDLTSYVLNTSFMKFCLPDKDEGFDEVRYDWQKADKCKEYLKCWALERKQTTRIEDLQPSEWFGKQWKEWQKLLQMWHAKQNSHKAEIAKK